MASQQPDIGIWGPSGAGKTTYLAGLMLALDKYHPEWTMWPGEGDIRAEQFLTKEGARIAEGHFPAPTALEPLLYTFRMWRQEGWLRKKTRVHELAFVDAAGELVLDADDKRGYFKTLRQCKGILCMVDPEISRDRGVPSPTDGADSYFTLVNRLAFQLAREGGLTAEGKLKTYLAFCVTKIDRGKNWPYREKPEQLLRDLIGDATFNRIMAVCDRRRVGFFAVSVVGRYRSAGGGTRPNLEPADDHYRIADLSKWSPYKPLDPLFWLFDQINASTGS